MSERPFIKMHGLRNHFVIVDAREQPFRPAAAEIAHICDVQAGIGADQLIVIEPSAKAGAFMRIWNVDGREAEACGNATRCVAWLLLEEGATDHVVIETRAGLLGCERQQGVIGERLVRCDMGVVRNDWQSIPLSRDCDTLHLPVTSGPLDDGVAVNVGNPHAVFFVDALDAVDVAACAPAVQSDPLFPDGVNVGVAEILADDHLRLVVYERGAGLTMACGSGACAAAWAARARDLASAQSIRVSLPGGDVQIELSDDGHAFMTGPVAFSFRGTLPG